MYTSSLRCGGGSGIVTVRCKSSACLLANRHALVHCGSFIVAQNRLFTLHRLRRSRGCR